jgi:LAO/AO transport system kinase
MIRLISGNDILHTEMKNIDEIRSGDVKSIARAISQIENEAVGYEEILKKLPENTHCGVIGITGPPGAGKSTLTDKLIELLLKDDKRVAVLCIDPSSPFHSGAILGDRIRMSSWYKNPNVYIRSLASRGILGGLHPNMIEITDLLRSANFDYIIIETIGVGQNEIEISGLADVTVVVLVPESGDDIQMMKSGIMEIADIFVVNKADRPDAGHFAKDIINANQINSEKQIPVIKTVAKDNIGIDELASEIKTRLLAMDEEKRLKLLSEKAYQLIVRKNIRKIDKKEIYRKIKESGERNIYKITEQF